MPQTITGAKRDKSLPATMCLTRGEWAGPGCDYRRQILTVVPRDLLVAGACCDTVQKLQATI